MNPKGLTLIEILIAVAVFVSSIMPIWYLFSKSSENIAEGEFESQILNVGNAFIEQVKRFQGSLLPETSDEIAIFPQKSNKYHLGGPTGKNDVYLPEWDAANIQLRYAVKKFPVFPKESKIVVLRVNWKGKAGRIRSASFLGMLCDE